MDKIDLHIMSLLDANCRTPYRSIGSRLGIGANAVKTRVNKMVVKGITNIRCNGKSSNIWI